MTLQDVVARFNTTPFIFAGAGVTKRYYGLPGWEELLKTFAERIDNNRFSYAAYKAKAQTTGAPEGLLPAVASLIQKDFDEAWFARKELRSLDSMGLDQVEQGVSPFKAEVAAYILRSSTVAVPYVDEVRKLQNIAKKNLAGVITTNYDLFFENLFEGYKSFVGQDELVFSAIQGIAEIYKIHGSVLRPDSIIINERDYRQFHEKGKYLAAKLMTIFMEYPIIFIGYSIGDSNIRNILTDIVSCLPESKFEKLRERFIFVEYKRGMTGVSIAPYSIDLNGRLLDMTRVTLANFSLLYDSLAVKRAHIPVKMLRRFKEDIYTYVITSQPTPTMQVAPLDDGKIDENSLCVTIGQTNTGEYGLKVLVDANLWYRDIVTDELARMRFSHEQLLDLAFPSAFKGLNGYFPVYKHLSQTRGAYPLVREHAAETFEGLISATIKKQRNVVAKYSSVKDLWEKEKKDLPKATRLLAYLPEEKFKADELYAVLRKIFADNENILSERTTNGLATNVRRLIRIYDYLRWAKNKDLPK